MVAVVSGAGLGLFGSSVSALGGIGASGNGAVGRGNDRVYVNTATGNLIIQSQDEHLSLVGTDLKLVRTYNSQGLLNDDNGDNWRLGVHQRLYNLTHFVNQAGSTITKEFGDGRTVVYSYDASSSCYVSTEGDGAHDTLTYSDGVWTWMDGSTRHTETYDSAYQLTSSSDADGNTVTYEYESSRLVRIRDAANQVTHLHYQGVNLSEIRVESNGLTQTLTRYVYDDFDRLTQVRVDLSPEDNASIDGDVFTTTYTYEGNSQRVASVTQGDGSTIVFTYEHIDGEFRIRSYSENAASVALSEGARTTTLMYSLSSGSSGTQSWSANGALLSTEESQTQTNNHGLNPAGLSTTHTTTSTQGYSIDLDALTMVPGGGWSAAELLETGQGVARSPQLMFDGGGNALAVWTYDSDTVVRRYDAATGTWGAPLTLDASSEYAVAPRLAIDQTTGDTIVAWVQSDGVADSIYVRLFNASSGAWSATQLLESGAGRVSGSTEDFSVAIAGEHAAVSWMQDDGEADSTYLARFHNGVWSAPALLESSDGRTMQAQVAIDAQGNATTVWRQWDGLEYRIYFNRWSAANAAFSGAVALDTYAEDGDRFPKIAFDLQGNGFALWGGGIVVRRYDAATGAWGAAVHLDNSGEHTGGWDLAVDAAGNAIVGWTRGYGPDSAAYACLYDADTGVWGTPELLDQTLAVPSAATLLLPFAATTP